MNAEAQLKVELELSMLLQNALQRRKQNGYWVSLSQLTADLDGRLDIARKVLLVSGFIPDREDEDRWCSPIGAGQYRPLEKVLNINSLVEVLKIYGPLGDS